MNQKNKATNISSPSHAFDEADQLGDLFKEEVQDPNFASGKMFGHYRIEKELGRGGMGIVYKAYDTKLNTFVALKLVIREEGTGSIQRFLREASATAQLNHPNIVRFYEAGESPKPYFTMEYIEGWTLSELIKEKKIKPHYLIDIMIKLCEALYVAHKNKILHRDIKPSNIMITKQGEPKIMDFGLAKLTKESAEQLSRSGQLLGTLLYMPPEQVNGEADERSDIYSIGATIYEAITYRPVFQGENQMNLIYQILSDLPIPPRELNPDISTYLEAICLKCISKKPKKRYDSFKQLEKELKNLKAHRPIIAKKYSQWDVLQNFLQKNKVICVGVLLLFIVMSVAFTVNFNTLNKVSEQRDIANEQRDIAKNEQKKAQDILNKTMRVIDYVYQKKLLTKDKEFAILSEKLLSTLEEYGEQEDWTNIKGYITALSGNTKKSVEYYSELIQKNPNDALSYVNRGLIYDNQKKYLEAEKDYSKAIALDPNYPNAYANRGFLYLNQKKYLEAEKDYSKAIALDPNYANVYVDRGNLYLNQRRYLEAEKDYNKAIALNPNHAVAYANRGILYYNQRKDKKAIQDWEKVVSLGYPKQKLQTWINKTKKRLNKTK